MPDPEPAERDAKTAEEAAEAAWARARELRGAASSAAHARQADLNSWLGLIRTQVRSATAEMGIRKMGIHRST